jgi:hypothetical protein
MLLLPMLEDDFYRDCTFGDRCGNRPHNDYASSALRYDGMRRRLWYEGLPGKRRKGMRRQFGMQSYVREMPARLQMSNVFQKGRQFSRTQQGQMPDDGQKRE